LGIRVNAIAPGFIETNMTKGPLSDKQFKKMILNNTPLSKVGDPGDIANAAIYLASEESRFVTGEVLYVDGGWTAR
jgi:NAD(P)-dependent dehydrogenase (short-subunit alcohol dehydrogenase family)